jgi:hypothetical protein|tara:strand:+ start:7360 stop:8502 length:1143 start_codon:yes stop_codon:yes gene_type:complete
MKKKEKNYRYNDRIEEEIKKGFNNTDCAKNILGYKDETLRKYISRYRMKNFGPNIVGITDRAEAFNVDASSVKHLWIKDKESSAFIKNPGYIEPELLKFQDLKKDLIKDIKKYSPSFPIINRVRDKDSYCLVIDPADVHIGKLCSSFETGQDYNQQLAVKRVKEGVIGILDKSRGFNIDKIIFIGGNDILHTDTPTRTTTSGTSQDTDGMWYDNFLMAKQLYVDVIETLISIADVHFVFNPSNHDYTNGFFLADVISTYFRKCKNITFDCSISHRKYTMYGNSLIGTTHGDGAKQNDLGMLMSMEAKDMWGKAKHRYFYTHHVHHKTAKDLINVSIESLRSPSPADSWHHRKGYQHSPEAIEGFIHSKEHGQVARLTHLF